METYKEQTPFWKPSRRRITAGTDALAQLMALVLCSGPRFPQAAQRQEPTQADELVGTAVTYASVERRKSVMAKRDQGTVWTIDGKTGRRETRSRTLWSENGRSVSYEQIANEQINRNKTKARTKTNVLAIYVYSETKPKIWSSAFCTNAETTWK